MDTIGIHFNAGQRPDRGTYKVASNLLKGLDKAGIPFRVNPPDGECRYNGFLQGQGWAYRNKRTDRRIMYGPNIVVLPREAAWCFGDGMRHVTPCEWVRCQYMKDPQCKAKVNIWPVGIDTDEYQYNRNVKKDCLIYFKTVTKQRSMVDLANAVKELDKRGLTYSTVTYGAYTDADFKRLCSEHKWMLVVAGTESQFIALLEAYAIGIPAYILDVQEMVWCGETYRGCGFTTAPYSDDRCGIVHPDYGRLEEFIDIVKEYRPRDYVVEQFDLADRARQYHKFLVNE